MTIKRPDEKDYRLLIEREWADFHHSRLQEWTAFGIVAGIHVGIMKLMDDLPADPKLTIHTLLLIVGPVIGILFAILGGLVTCRHERLKKIKMQWIGRAEYFLYLMRELKGEKGLLNDNIPNPRIIPNEYKDNDLWIDINWKGIKPPRLFSTSWLILCFYCLLVLVDIGFLLYDIFD